MNALFKRYSAIIGNTLFALLLVSSSSAYARPDSPRNLTGSIDNNTVVVEWSEVAGASGYNVYVNNSYLTTTKTNQFTGTVESGEIYSFYVTTFTKNPTEFSGRSEQLTLPESAIPEDLTIPPSKPTGLSGSIVDTLVSVSWEPSTDDEAVAGYNVYQDGQYLTTVFDTSYFGDVVADQSYTYAIVAFDTRVNFSSKSESLRLPNTNPIDTPIPPSTTAPSTPTGLTGIITDAGSQSRVSLSWNAATDDQAVKGYNVYENDDYKTTVFGTEYTGTVEADTPYSYYIVAFDFDRNFAKRTDTISISGATGMTDNTIATDDNDTTDDTDATDGSDSNGDTDANNDSDSSENADAGDDTDSNDNTNNTDSPDSNDGADTDDNDATDGADTEDDLENVVDTEAPSAPTNLVGTWTQNGDTADINLEWTASTDNVAIAGYNIYENKRYLTTVGQTAFSTTVNSGSPYSYRIVAFDIARNFSRPSFSRTLPDGDNLAPAFAGLENQTAFAGETVSILIKPTDIDGETPGLFIGSLPTGMRSDDNLNGTRTLHWRPLQPDVGSYDITVTAFDSADSALRTVQTFTLTIAMPEDETTIRNASPGIDGIGEHLVRVGDTVVMRVKATDANGTVPDLRMENLPTDASFEQDPEEPLIKILRWKTSAIDKGLNTLKFTATDSVDPSLVANSSVPINVVEAAQFNKSGERLRTLAAQNELLIGYASLLNYFIRPDADLYKATAADEFNLVTAENSMKWGYINPEPGKYRFAAADELVSFATENDMTLHGHTLLWYTSLPQWVQTSAKDKREGIMNDFIDTMTGRYNTVAIWDVVNEAFEDDGSYRNSIWFDAMGENYIEKAFRRARAGAPNAELIYNDYDIAAGDAKTDASFTLMEMLIANDAPIDGIGFQMHIDSDFSDFDKVAATFERFANLGLDIYITEMDVSQVDGTDEDDQARVYKEVLRVCLEQPACKALQVWGVTDRYTWLRGEDPLLFDRDYQPKPAYRALQELLAE